jgi:hypothetical protein
MSYTRLASFPGAKSAFNLFRRRNAPDLYCAVAQSHPVPAFIEGTEWEFAGAIRGETDGPRGFQAAEARIGSHLNGFYLFMAHQRMAPARREAA